MVRSEERRVGKECRSRCDWSSDVCSSDLAADMDGSDSTPLEFAQYFAPPRIAGARPLANFTNGAAAADAKPLRVQSANVDAGRGYGGIERRRGEIRHYATRPAGRSDHCRTTRCSASSPS